MYCYTADGDSSRHQANHVAHSDLMALSCNSLRQNFIGELDVFQNGDSVLDLFYKYSAKQQFCLHSDWALGYMVSLYLHTDISKLVEPQRCSNHHKCELLFSITCHNHGPEDMQNFARERDRESSIPARVPNVLLVGAQKAGTTAVAKWLFSEHAVCSAQTFADEEYWMAKEVHFFDIDQRFEQGAEFYQQRFNHCNSSDFIMDATPNYATHAIRIGNFYRESVPSNYSVANTPLDGFVQGLKVMMILREPVSRELSWYNHKASTSGLWEEDVLKFNHSFDEYTDEELLRKPTQFLDDGQCYGRICRSLYSKLISQWLQVIPRSQMLILSYQELKNDPGTFMKRIEDFLGLPPHKPNATFKRANVKSFAEKTFLPSCRSKNKLAGIFQPFNEELYALLRQNPGPPMEQSPFPEFDVQGCIPD